MRHHAAVRAGARGDAAVGGRPQPASRRTSATRSSATARWSPCCATPRSPRSWSTARTRSTSSARARSTPSRRRSPATCTCAAPSTRSSAGSAGASTRRSPMVDARLPDGSRVNAVIPPIALDGSMLTIRKFAADPFTDRDLIALRHASPRAVRDVLQACVLRPAQHPDLRRHRLRQDDPAQRPVRLHPRRRAHRHHRGRRRAAAAPAARAAAGVAAAEHRGQGRGRHPRPGAQLAADAPRPHRRRRGPRRRRARHAPGDEHRPRRLDHHRARQHARATASRAWRPWS